MEDGVILVDEGLVVFLVEEEICIVIDIVIVLHRQGGEPIVLDLLTNLLRVTQPLVRYR